MRKLISFLKFDSKEFKIKILNLVLRLGTIGLRFLLTLFISKFFSISLLGEYTIINTTITLGVLLVGFDFYNYTSKKIVKEEFIPTAIVNQLVFNLIFHVICFTVFYYGFELLFGDTTIPFLLLYAILFFEHLSMECFRFFSSISKPLIANFVQFFKAGFWIVFFGLFYSIFPDKDSQVYLVVILVLWLIGCILSVLLTIVYCLKHYDFKGVRVDEEYLKIGFHTSIILFTSTISQKIIEYSDRYMIEYYLGKEQLGIFSLYFQFANMINIINYTLVFMIEYPKIYLYSEEKDEAKYNESIKKVLNQTHILYAILILFILPITYYLPQLLSKPIISPYFGLFPLMAFGGWVMNVQIVKKTELLALNSHRIIIMISSIGAAINLIVNFILIQHIGLFAVALSTLISYVVMLYISKIHVNKSIKKFFTT